MGESAPHSRIVNSQQLVLKRGQRNPTYALLESQATRMSLCCATLNSPLVSPSFRASSPHALFCKAKLSSLDTRASERCPSTHRPERQLFMIQRHAILTLQREASSTPHLLRTSFTSLPHQLPCAFTLGVHIRTSALQQPLQNANHNPPRREKSNDCTPHPVTRPLLRQPIIWRPPPPLEKVSAPPHHSGWVVEASNAAWRWGWLQPPTQRLLTRSRRRRLRGSASSKMPC